MSRYRFDLATPADDASLRRILAETPMDGHIAVSFRREPSYFRAAAVDGRFRQVVTARDAEQGRPVGFGSRSISRRYVNGAAQDVGYLSSLRLLAEHRNRGLVARGYRYFRQLHADGRTPLYLTTIADGNEASLAILTSGRAGLPVYHPAGKYHTLVLPLGGRSRKVPRRAAEIRPARHEDVPQIVAFLNATGPRRQFFPRYEPHDFFTGEGALAGLEPQDLLLAFRGERLVGTLAAWDQHAFRQSVVHGYRGAMRWTRPAYNAWAAWQGWPRLPDPGKAFHYLTAALGVVEDDEIAVFETLLDGLLIRAAGGAADHLLVGLHERDPLLAAARRRAVACYTTLLYLVCWPDGDETLASLDDRCPYLELGSL